MFGEYRRIIISLPCIGILVWEGEVHVRGVPKNNNFPALYRYFSMGGRRMFKYRRIIISLPCMVF